MTFEATVILKIETRKTKLVGCLTVHLPHEIKSHGTIRTVNTTYAAALKTTIHPKTRCRKPYAATQRLMLLMMGICSRNKSR